MPFAHRHVQRVGVDLLDVAGLPGSRDKQIIHVARRVRLALKIAQADGRLIIRQGLLLQTVELAAEGGFEILAGEPVRFTFRARGFFGGGVVPRSFFKVGDGTGVDGATVAS